MLIELPKDEFETGYRDGSIEIYSGKKYDNAITLNLKNRGADRAQALLSITEALSVIRALFSAIDQIRAKEAPDEDALD